MNFMEEFNVNQPAPQQAQPAISEVLLQRRQIAGLDQIVGGISSKVDVVKKGLVPFLPNIFPHVNNFFNNFFVFIFDLMFCNLLSHRRI